MSAGGGDQKSEDAKSGCANSQNPISPVNTTFFRCHAGAFRPDAYIFLRGRQQHGPLKRLAEQPRDLMAAV